MINCMMIATLLTLSAWIFRNWFVNLNAQTRNQVVQDLINSMERRKFNRSQNDESYAQALLRLEAMKKN